MGSAVPLCRIPRCHLVVTCALGVVAGEALGAQPGGFVMLLGRDTVQVESFTRSGQHITGTVLTRAPRAQQLRYDITLTASGRLRRYEQVQLQGDGRPLTPAAPVASLQLDGDTIVRAAPQRDGTLLTQRIAAPGGAYPLGTIPLGASFAVFELALADLRTASRTPPLTLNRLLPLTVQSQPSQTRVLYAAPDSVEIDYFGQGRFGFRFDDAGRIVRSDWRGTTYQVQVSRVASVDVAHIGQAWARADAAGTGAGALSPRDSVSIAMGDLTGFLTYSRPAARGRAIWGALVPFDRVWRLGADFATRLQVNRAVRIGDAVVPAGEYTLWMLPSSGESLLIVSRLQRVFGTQYTPTQDLVRVPMRRQPLASPVERLTIALREDRFVVAWGDTAFEVTVR